MKKINKKNKFLLGGLIILFFVAMLFFSNVFSVSSFDSSFDRDQVDNMYLSASDGSGDLLNVRVAKGFDALAIYTSTDNAFPGKSVDISMATTFPPFGDLTSAKFLLYDDSWTVVKSWDFIGELKTSFGCSPFIGACVNYGSSQVVDMDMSFNAPIKPGTYHIAYRITGKRLLDTSYITLAQENREFKVLSSTCPDDSKTVYETFKTFTGGHWEKRTVNEYGSFPKCTLDTFEETRTVCDSGWEAVGSSTRYSSGAVSCERETVLVDCWKCNGEDLADGEFANECPPGWYDYELTCESEDDSDDEEDVNCYICDDDYELVTESFPNKCPLGYNDEIINCEIPSVTCYACNVDTNKTVSFVQEGSVCPDNTFEDSDDATCGNSNNGGGDDGSCEGLSLSDRALSFEKPCGLGLYSVVFIGLFILLIIGIILRGKRR